MHGSPPELPDNHIGAYEYEERHAWCSTTSNFNVPPAKQCTFVEIFKNTWKAFFAFIFIYYFKMINALYNSHKATPKSGWKPLLEVMGDNSKFRHLEILRAAPLHFLFLMFAAHSNILGRMRQQLSSSMQENSIHSEAFNWLWTMA